MIDKDALIIAGVFMAGILTGAAFVAWTWFCIWKANLKGQIMAMKEVNKKGGIYDKKH